MRVFFVFMLLLTMHLIGDEIDIDDFEGLMGKSTSHWRHLVQAQDVETLKYAETVYQKNKMAQYIQEGGYKIPATIHFIWLGTRPFPPESVENVRTWIGKHPGWKVKFWTDRDREPPCEGMEKVFVKNFSFLKLGESFEQSQNWRERSDLLRYEILFQEGGVYVDHDAKCLQSFGGIHRGYDFFCGLEPPHEPFVGRSITCGNGVIGARPHHPTVGKVIDLVAHRWKSLGEKFRGRDDHSQIEVVMQRTYIALTDAMAETINCEGNVDIIFPAAYFFSKSGIPSLYSKHFLSRIWDGFKVEKMQGFEERGLGKIREKNRNLTLLFILLLAFNGLVLGFYLMKRRKS
jgi:hypothetical protein